MAKVKGVILAGGSAMRLYPLTYVLNKHLLPVYNKPMIYYPMSLLMLSGIRDLMIVSTSEGISQFKGLFGDGSSLGISISYAVQEKPLGLAHGFMMAEEFLKDADSSVLIFGDNIFFGHDLPRIIRQAMDSNSGATIFGYSVRDPERFGVVEFDENDRVLSVEEKPQKPKSEYAAVGLYVYDKTAIAKAKALKPSVRGELEITDLNNRYLAEGTLKVRKLGRGIFWVDAGTTDSLFNAGNLVKSVETVNNSKIGCIEEAAFMMGYITLDELKEHASRLSKTEYGAYLAKIIKDSPAEKRKDYERYLKEGP
jgi:glucose-1-phosphate thymidylyltransferase